MGPDLTPYVPRLALEWDSDQGPERRHAGVEGTLVFADVSGFTRLSERLALAGGRLGAEQLTEVINALFEDLLTVAVARGGEMLKYGGDAVLLFFRGEQHTPRAVAASVEMQQRLRDIGRVETGAGAVRMRMSVGVHTGTFDMFLVGRAHRDLIIAGPATTRTIEIEAAAAATEVLVSDATAKVLDERVLGGERDGARLVRRRPDAPDLEAVHRGRDDRAGDFVPTRLREHLRGGAAEPEHRLVTQAFIHVTGLDGLLADRGGAAAAEDLHQTVAAIQDASDHYGITYLSSDIAPDGVKVILVAGAPSAVEDPEARMVAVLDAVREGACPLPIRAGAHCGHVFTGDVGPPFRRTYTTIGDVTNTAARVMGHARPGEVLALGNLVDTLSGIYAFEELPAFAAKGKRERLVPYRLGSTRAEAQQSTDVQGDVSPMPFTGRGEALAALVDAVSSARLGSGTVVEVVGDVGVGKTRMVNEVVARVGLPVRRLSCEPFESTTPYFVVGHVVAAVLGCHRGATPATLARAVSTRCSGLSPWLPLIAETVDIEVAETSETESLDPRYRRQRTARVVVDLLTELVTDPTVLVFEDVQWLDESSGDVLHHLESEVAVHPWSVVLTRRDEAEGHLPSDGVATTWVLEPLDAASTTALVEAASAADPLPPYRVQQIVERSAGNPLFVEGLLRTDAFDDDDEAQLPDSIEAVVAAEIDRLPTTARRLLRLAAVHGHSFELADLVATAEEDGIDLALTSASAAARLVGGSLVVERTQRLRFRHHVLREVAYGSLPFRERRLLHGNAADVLLRQMGETADDRIGPLSQHEWHAGRYEACWEHSRLAGVRAAAKYAHVEATAAFRRAIAAAGMLDARCAPADEVSDVWESLGDAAAMTGESRRAAAHYKHARRLTSSRSAFARLCGKEARLAEINGARARARRWLRRGLEALEQSDDEIVGLIRASLLARSAWTAAQDGRHTQAVELAQRAIDDGMAHGNVEAMGHAHVVMDGSLQALGRTAEVDHSEQALACFEMAGAVAAKAGALNNLGISAYYRGEWARARRYYDEAQAANLAAGNVVEAGYQTYNAAEILIDQGRLEEAESLLDDLERLWRSVRLDVGLVFAAGLRGVLALRQGRFEEARTLLDDSRRQLHEAGLRPHAAAWDLAAAEAVVASDDLVAARRTIDGLRQGAVVATVPDAHARLLRLEGALAAREGDPDQARRLVASSIEHARESGSLFQLLLGLSDLGQLGQHATRTSPSVEDEIRQLTDRLGIAQLPAPLVAPSR